MRTITKTFTAYKFDELTKEQQAKAIQNYHDINTDHDWWESVYYDLETISVTCDGFNTDRGSYCKLKFNTAPQEVAQNILVSHGTQCDTYKAAQAFLANWQPLYNEYLDETSKHYESPEHEDKMTALEDDFLAKLSRCYLIILRAYYNYLTSDEAIRETLIANDYEFTANGKIHH